MEYDYIFSGAGCAALSLATAMQETCLREKRILLIDRDAKQQNDRTWCYWTDKPSRYDHIARKVWHQIAVHTQARDFCLPLAPYRYQMLRGIDFYEEARNVLAQNPRVTWLQSPIKSLESTTQGALVHTENGTFRGQWVFNSLPSPAPLRRQDIVWYQHFRGFFMKTKRAIFDENTATFMDFRTPQGDEVRFIYILPTSPTEALVEFTVFGRQVWESAAYLPPLLAYLQARLGLCPQDYEITEEELGVIPMTTQPFVPNLGSFITHIGTAGGRTKASTGFTFYNIQKHTEQLIEGLLAYGAPIVSPTPARYALFDHILLDVLDKNRLRGCDVFETLFSKHPVQRIFRFLNNESSYFDELKILASVPPLPFMRSVLEIFSKSLSF